MMRFRQAVLGTTVVAAAALQVSGEALRFPGPVHEIGVSPGGAVGADFDGDGRLDLAVTNYGSNDLSILRGRGDGTFEPERRQATGRNPAAIVTADLDADGRTDLLVWNQTGHDGTHADLSVLLGHGDGTFADELVTPLVASNVRNFAVGDFDQDGVPDLAVADVAHDTLAIFLGRGDGTFAPSEHPAVGDEPTAVATADLDHDGHLDLVAGNAHESNFSVLMGRGDGTFAPQIKSPSGGQTRYIVLGDFDDDGETDVATNYGGSSRTVGVFRGRGNGTFAPGVFYQCAVKTVFLTIGDPNGDGREDLLVANGSESVSLFLGRADGSFAAELRQGVGAGPATFVPGRFDADGREDLAVALIGADVAVNGVVVHLGNGDGSYGPPVVPLTGVRVSDIVVADFDADGRRDLATVNTFTNDVSFVHGLGGGRFVEAQRYRVGSFPVALTTGDFDEDGNADLAVANDPGYIGGFSTAGDASILRGRGDGTFDPERRLAVGGRPDAIVAADLDEDGHLDLVVADGDDNTGGGLALLFGRGDGTFLPATRRLSGSRPRAVAAALLNGDGHIDLAVASSGNPFAGVNPSILLVAGNGDGSFAPAVSVAQAVRPADVLTGDVDGDGFQDLVFADNGNPFPFFQPYDPGRVACLFGRQDGGFEPALTLQADLNPRRLALGDVDGDATRDVIAGDSTTELSVVRGLGGRLFAKRARVAPPGMAEGLAVADFDGDGHDDLVTGNYPGVAVLLSRRSPDDGDGDGVPDVADNCRTLANSDQANADGDAVGDVCDRCAHDPLDDIDRDGLCADRDVCPGVFDPAQPDRDHDGVGDLCDNCPDAPNPGQQDLDGDGRADACDNCPGVPNANQADADADKVGDACDRCATVSDPSQNDRDADQVGDACDNCIAVANPDQADANADGSGDACQPTIAILGLEHRPEATITVAIDTQDPQNDPLGGRLTITPLDPTTATIPETLDLSSCPSGWSPGGVVGEGLGYANVSMGAPYLFDLDSQIGCADGLPDYRLALGACAAPTGPFDTILPLAGLTLPAAACARPMRPGSGDVDLTLLAIAPDRITFAALGHAPIIDIASPEGVPHRTDIASLPDGARYRLTLTVTDGSTVPVQASVEWTRRGETTLVVGRPPRAVAAVPGATECDRPGAGGVALDGAASFDPDAGGRIVSFAWFAAPGTPGETFLGEGVELLAALLLGATQVGLRVTDEDGMTGWTESTATVVDTTPPSLAVTAEPAALWPPNHTLRSVRAVWHVSDACDPSPTVRLVDAHSSEPDDGPGPGDGETAGDVVLPGQGAPADSLLLRAERDGAGSGRVYELLARATDASGNAVDGLGVVTVPHDQGSGPDPLLLRVEPAGMPGRVRVQWSGWSGATGYDLIAGDLANLQLESGRVALGPVDVLVRAGTGTTFVETIGRTPEPGRGFFYLIQARTLQGGTGFGSEPVPWPRLPTSCTGGCP